MPGLCDASITDSTMPATRLWERLAEPWSDRVSEISDFSAVSISMAFLGKIIRVIFAFWRSASFVLLGRTMIVAVGHNESCNKSYSSLFQVGEISIENRIYYWIQWAYIKICNACHHFGVNWLLASKVTLMRPLKLKLKIYDDDTLGE